MTVMLITFPPHMDVQSNKKIHIDFPIERLYEPLRIDSRS